MYSLSFGSLLVDILRHTINFCNWCLGIESKQSKDALNKDDDNRVVQKMGCGALVCHKSLVGNDVPKLGDSQNVNATLFQNRDFHLVPKHENVILPQNWKSQGIVNCRF